jgi:molybdenum cofactor cytidylyltransferase
MNAPAVVGILLAAGKGERFGGDKLLAQLGDGEAPIAVVACRHLGAALRDVIAVVRPGDTLLAQQLSRAGASIVVAEHARDGMGASLAAGVGAAPQTSGYVVALADMPWIEPATIRGVAAAIEAGASIAAPSYRGQRGHPVGFASLHRDALLLLRGDEGAKKLVAQHREALKLIDTNDPGVLRDVDTPRDLA